MNLKYQLATTLSRRVDELELWIPAIEQAEEQAINNRRELHVKLRQADEALELAKSHLNNKPFWIGRVICWHGKIRLIWRAPLAFRLNNKRFSKNCRESRQSCNWPVNNSVRFPNRWS